jgi:quercetin dioxygenase-like cupin family protein
MRVPAPQVIVEDERVRVRVVQLPAGEASPWHRHSELEEHIVALSDGLVLEQADPWVRIELSRGSVVGVDAARPHRLENRGDGPGPGAYLLVQKGRYDFVEHVPTAPITLPEPTRKAPPQRE